MFDTPVIFFPHLYPAKCPSMVVPIQGLSFLSLVVASVGATVTSAVCFWALVLQCPEWLWIGPRQLAWGPGQEEKVLTANLKKINLMK